MVEVRVLVRDDPSLRDVIALGDSHKATLGLLPREAIAEAAAAGGVLVATSGGQLAGYALTRRTRRHLAIVHLCVADFARGQGVADALFDHVKQDSAGSTDIVLSCRRDFRHARALWQRLGFELAGDRPGRATRGSVLERWVWRSAVPPLLSLGAETRAAEVRWNAALDMQVFLDLVDESRTGDGADESRWLVDDTFSEDLRLWVGPEVHAELVRAGSDARTADRRMADFERFERSARAADDVRRRIEAILGAPRSERDRSDQRHLADVAVSSSRVDTLVTRDSHLLGHTELIEREIGVRVRRPVELVAAILAASDIEPVEHRISGLDVARREIRGADVRLFERFLDSRADDARASFDAWVRRLVAGVESEIAELYEIGGEPVALLAARAEGRVLVVERLRWTRDQRERALVGFLLDRVVRDALRRGCLAVLFGDRLLTRADAGVLESAGVVTLHNAQGVKFVLSDSARDTAALLEVAEQVASESPVLAPAVQDLRAASAQAVSSREQLFLERALFPSVRSDVPLPCWIVPIRPNYAMELFDDRMRQSMLFPPEGLHSLAFRNVYYSRAATAWRWPARILWYVSGDAKQPASKAIRAASVLETAHRATARQLSRYQQLGVYDRTKLETMASGEDGLIWCLRFSCTRTFETPISYGWLMEALREEGVAHANLVGPTEIPHTLFLRILKEGGHAAG